MHRPLRTSPHSTLTTATLNVAYDPSKASQGPLATLCQQRIQVVDLADIRSERNKIGYQRDKYGLKGAPIRTAVPVPQIVREALAAEFACNGHRGASETTDVTVSGNISAFWLDLKVGFWTSEIVATVAVHLSVANAGTNELIFSQGYQGVYSEKGTGKRGQVEGVMNMALERLVREISTDPHLIRVLDSLPRSRQPTLTCWTCGREVCPMRFRADDLRRQGWAPPQTLQIPDWCGCSTEYLPVPTGDGWWSLVPIWEPTQTVNPLRRYGPTEPR